MSQIPLLELDLLKSLVAIAETGNFSAAAEVVHRTPSAISMQVKRMEELLGRPIFIREPRSVVLNEDGEMLVAHARRMLALNADTVAKFAAPGITGMVRLGAIDHAADRFLPGMLREFANTHPQVRVDVSIENTNPQRDALRRDEMDIAIVSCTPGDTDFPNYETLFQEKLVWAGLKGGIAPEQDPLPVSVWEEGCVWRASALEGLATQERDYRVTFKSAHLAGQKAGIRADLAIAPLPLSACDGDIVPLGDRHGLPDLGYFTLGMAVRPNAENQIVALAESLRAYAQNPERFLSNAA